jgi:hypothetical protein
MWLSRDGVRSGAVVRHELSTTGAVSDPRPTATVNVAPAVSQQPATN